MLKKLCFFLVLLASLVYIGCSQSSSGDGGGEDPGGNKPGSEDPGSEDPGGEDPGGEDPDDIDFTTTGNLRSAPDTLTLGTKTTIKKQGNPFEHWMSVDAGAGHDYVVSICAKTPDYGVKLKFDSQDDYVESETTEITQTYSLRGDEIMKIEPTMLISLGTYFDIWSFTLNVEEVAINGSWAPHGEDWFGDEKSYNSAMAVDSVGNLWLANEEPVSFGDNFTTRIRVYLYRASGSSWEAVTTGMPAQTNARKPSIAIGSDNKVYVGYLDKNTTDNDALRVISYNRTSWALAGSQDEFDDYQTDKFKLLIDSTDTPHVIISHDSGNQFGFQYLTFSDPTWTEKSFSTYIGSTVTDIEPSSWDAALDADDKVHLATNGAQEYWVWDGTDFVSPVEATRPSPSSGYVYIQKGSDNKLWTIQKSGSVYELVQESSSGRGVAYTFGENESVGSFVMDGTLPVVPRGTRIVKWNETTWDQLGAYNVTFGEYTGLTLCAGKGSVYGMSKHYEEDYTSADDSKVVVLKYTK